MTQELIKKQTAFTLAEGLITLGIIGVVAAMTMPALINETRRKQDSVKIKKFYSTMSQAILMSEQDNGSAADWTVNSAIRDDEGTIIDYQGESTLAFFQQYLAPYIKTISSTKTSGSTGKVIFNDGSVLHLGNGNCIDMIFDVNGDKRPNSNGYDRFDFLFCNKNFNESYLGVNKYFGSYYQKLALTYDREYIKNRCKTNPLYCSTLLIIDDFEFKKDYPFR